MIRAWSKGEVTNPETINYRTLKAERGGLFCEEIFGPTKDWECSCGNYKGIRFKGRTCEKCHTLITEKRVRRERMGHIELACPVSHIWYLRGIPSKIGLLLDVPPKALENVVYYIKYIVTDPGDTGIEPKKIIDQKELEDLRRNYHDNFKVGMGAEAIRELLEKIDIEALSAELKAELEGASGQKKVRLIKRLDVVEAFRRSGNRPEWMIITVLPVLPPDVRPMVQLDGGRFASSDINDLYRRIINRNNILKKFLQDSPSDIVVNNEKRMLQDAVDALIDNGKRGKPVTGPSSRPLKSLSEMLRGKQGRFRQNLLGKRVDYSGRSVIVVGHELKIYQCGLPKEMALELFKPFIIKRLVERGDAVTIKDAKRKIDKGIENCVWDALENVIKEHPVLLNRAPTLLRLSIQAFEPVLVEGRAIKLHPLVCTAFNADFDGDQMPVHVPLSAEAQAEARLLMLSANNLLKPVDGKAVTVPSQDMVLGSYYLTIDKDGEKGEGNCYRNFDEAIMAYQDGDLGLHARIKVRVEKEINGVKESRIIDATLGRLIFNNSIPQDIGFANKENIYKGKKTVFGQPFDYADCDKIGTVNRDFTSTDENVQKHLLDLEVNCTCGKKQLKQIVDLCIEKHGFTVAAEVLDSIKAMGYKYSTKASISISIADVTIPEEKQTIIAGAEANVEKIRRDFNRGKTTEEERYKAVIQTWQKATDDVVNALQEKFDRYNPIKMMSDSGARGNMTQMRQLAGMRGLMFATNGRTMEIPIKSNFREGLNILDYFSAARGARKSLSDTALKTADSGYLTRRLVDVSQDVIVREVDCGAVDGLEVAAIAEGKETIEPLKDRLVGRYTANCDAGVVRKEDGTIIIDKNSLITGEIADEIINAGIEKVTIRSLLNCRARYGVCARCYGTDLANGKDVQIGEAVGIIAAQSIGEPGTQLTMRTFHTGGVAGSDITQGLPRVEELFEARRPKKNAIVSEFAGTVSTGMEKKMKAVYVTSFDEEKRQTYLIAHGLEIIVKDGDKVGQGDALTGGYKAPADILKVNGLDAVYSYIITEVQKVYRSQSIDINDKHIEVIARQMTKKVIVDDPGDTDLLLGSWIDLGEFREKKEEIERRIDAGERTLRVPVVSPTLLGISKAALQSESFLSAASFQTTTTALADAAVKGKTDRLLGLKENVLIGKLIPAGTGMERYRNINVIDTGKESAQVEEIEKTEVFASSDDYE
ncbi:MAG: DNA-directed RNA polymerase subunit beta' [Firmicutes bacterium]|nr:DNA-directed RNA polymerase subunit beta' [Candidatus Colimorpha enterica]